MDMPERANQYVVRVLSPELGVIVLPLGIGIRTPTKSFDTREQAEAYRLQLLVDKESSLPKPKTTMTKEKALKRLQDCRITSLGKLAHGYVIYESVAIQLINEIFETKE